MRDALTVLGPLFGFMLLPVWIPVLAVAVGWVGEQLGSGRHDEVAARFAAVKERSHAHRTAKARHQVVVAEPA
jgi:hypothetical protein